MAPVPAVEIPQHRGAAGIGGPQAELNPRHAVLFHQVGAHAPPDVVVVALGKQQLIQLSHPGIPEGPGIVLDVLDTTPQHPHLVARRGLVGAFGLKHPGMVGGGHGDGLAALQQLHPFGFGHPDPHHPATAFKGLGAQQGERMVVLAVGQAMAVLHHPIKAEQGHVATAFAPRA